MSWCVVCVYVLVYAVAVLLTRWLTSEAEYTRPRGGVLLFADDTTQHDDNNKDDDGDEDKCDDDDDDDAYDGGDTQPLLSSLLYCTDDKRTTTTTAAAHHPLPRQECRKLAFLERHCCALPVRSAHVRVLDSPSAFYREMRTRIAAAQHSIVLSALYIGDGTLSHEFMQCIEQKLTAVAAAQRASATSLCAPFTVTLLLDYNRMGDKRNLCTVQRLLAHAHALQQEAAATATATATARAASNSDSNNSHDTDNSNNATSASPLRLSVRVFLFQSPCRWNRLFRPLARAQEALGVQHTKIFVFDAVHTVLTGANLSDDYFTSRIDRYLVLEHNRYVARWFAELVEALTTLSHPIYYNATRATLLTSSASSTTTTTTTTTTMSNSNDDNTDVCRTVGALDVCACGIGYDPTYNVHAYVDAAAAHMECFAQRMRMQLGHSAREVLTQQVTRLKSSSSSSSSTTARTRAASGDSSSSHDDVCRDVVYDTLLFPTLQMGRVGLRHDSAVVRGVLQRTAAHEHVWLTSPYLNLHPMFMHVMLRRRFALDCVTASVEANGWAGQRGMAGYIPYFYLQLERFFYYLVQATPGCGRRVRVREFARAGHTFHAKGLWFLSTHMTTRTRCAKVDAKEDGGGGESGDVCMRKSKPSVTVDDDDDEDKDEGSSDSDAGSDKCKYKDDCTDGEAAVVVRHASHTHNNDDDHHHHNSNAAAVAALDHTPPYLVAYGSTNYGHRSVHKDVEAEAFVYTRSARLRAALGAELHAIVADSHRVTAARFTGHAKGRFQPVVSLLAQLGQDFL